MAIIHLDYVPKSGPNLLAGFSPDVREEILASYVQLGARAKNPDFAYTDGQRVGEFVVRAKETAVEAVNTDLIRLNEGQRTLHVAGHTAIVRATAPKDAPVALIEAYDAILPPKRSETRKGKSSRTLLGSLTEIVAQSSLTPV